MKCKRVAALLPFYLDGELETPLEAAVEFHLRHCEPCSKELKVYEALRSALRRHAPVRPPTDFVVRTLHRIQQVHQLIQQQQARLLARTGPTLAVVAALLLVVIQPSSLNRALFVMNSPSAISPRSADISKPSAVIAAPIRTDVNQRYLKMGLQFGMIAETLRHQPKQTFAPKKPTEVLKSKEDIELAGNPEPEEAEAKAMPVAAAPPPPTDEDEKDPSVLILLEAKQQLAEGRASAVQESLAGLLAQENLFSFVRLEAQLLLKRSYEATGEKELAAALQEKISAFVLEQSEDAETAWQLAELLEGQGEVELAQRLYEEVAKRNKGTENVRTQAYQRLATLYERRGDLDKASAIHKMLSAEVQTKAEPAIGMEMAEPVTMPVSATSVPSDLQFFLKVLKESKDENSGTQAAKKIAEAV